MGQAARDAYYRRTTPGQRFDAGLDLADEAIAIVLTRLDLPPNLSKEERVRRQFQAIREAGS